MGKPQRREQEPGRFQSTHMARPGIHTIDMQIKCKFVFFFFPVKNLQIRPFWKCSMPDQPGGGGGGWGGWYPGVCWPPSLSSSTHVTYRKTVRNPVTSLDSFRAFLQRTFPSLDKRAQSTDGEKEALRDSGPLPCTNSPPGGWQGSWNLLTIALGYQRAYWGRGKSAD